MKIEKVERLVTNQPCKIEYVIHIRNLKQALNRGLIWKRAHIVIKFNQKAWLKPYTDINTELRKKAKNYFQKDYFKLMNNALSEKIMENVGKYRDIKLLTTNARKNYLVPEQNYQTTNFFSENLLAINEKKKHKHS